jgi:hypothetical protein
MRDFEYLSLRAALRNGISLFQLQKLPPCFPDVRKETYLGPRLSRNFLKRRKEAQISKALIILVLLINTHYNHVWKRKRR